MKYPMKLRPLRPATRAGQNAMATQMIIRMRPLTLTMVLPQA